MGREHWKKIWVGSAGNMVEWFDWFVYATFAVYFADSFFPKGNETAEGLGLCAGPWSSTAGRAEEPGLCPGPRALNGRTG
jgi:hypothetical protein